MHKKKFIKKIIHNTLLLGICSLVYSGMILAEDVPQKNYAEPIAPGVVHESYSWGTYYGPIRFDVLKCDLNNSNLDLRLIAGQGEYTHKATVSSMAQNTNATAMINGDFFNMALEGAPIGPSIINGTLASSPAVIQGIYSLGISDQNVASIEAMTYDGAVIASDGSSFPIDGLNKTYYWHDPSGHESHTNLIQMYNDMWGSSSRGHANNTEVLINAQGVVEKISYGKTLPYEVPDSKIILQVNGSAEAFIKKHCPIGSKVTIHSKVVPDKNWKFLVGGHALLTNQGKVVPYTKDLNALAGVRARTAAGVSKDGKTLWLVCAEGRTNRSVGAQLSTLGYFMQYLGAYKSVNLDGGGSTTMVLKHYGDTNLSTVIAPEGNGWLRPVVNGIGIYNSMQIGTINDFQIKAPNSMVVGETVALNIDKCVDEYYHPLSIKNTEFTAESKKNMGKTAGMYYLGLAAGEESIEIKHKSGLSKSVNIKIQGEEGLKNLRLEADKFMVNKDAVVHFKLIGTKLDGSEVVLDPRVADWTLEGFSGSINGSSVTITNTNDLPNGKVTVRIGKHQSFAWLGNEAYNLLDLYIDQHNYWLNGKMYTLDQPPIISHDRTLVPIRLITESLDGKVEWTDNKKPIIIEYKGHQLELLINSKKIKVDGVEMDIDVPPQIVNNRTLIPIRVVSEQLGMSVEYDGQTRCVSICGKK